MAMTIDEALEKLRDPTVTELNLWGCDFGEAEAKQIAVALPDSQITSLSFYGNSISDAGAAALAGALPHSQVASLSFYGNSIGDAGAAALAGALPHSQVTELYLSNNNIGAAGTAALATALPQSQVTVLYLAYNYIGAAGATAIAGALPQSQIRSLHLAVNNISNVGATALAGALPHSQVTELNLDNNHIGDAGATALATALPHSQVTSLDLNNNSIGDAEKTICHGKTAENACLALALAQKLVAKTPLEQPDRIALQRLAQAVANYLGQKHRLDEATGKNMLLGAAEQFVADDIPQTKAFALRVLPLPEAREWLQEKDIELTIADFLTPEGRIPQGRFLCQGGVRALFLEEDLWETAAQANKALRHLPPEQKAFIPNAHTLLANLSKRVVVPAGPEVG